MAQVKSRTQAALEKAWRSVVVDRGDAVGILTPTDPFGDPRHSFSGSRGMTGMAEFVPDSSRRVIAGLRACPFSP